MFMLYSYKADTIHKLKQVNHKQITKDQGGGRKGGRETEREAANLHPWLSRLYEAQSFQLHPCPTNTLHKMNCYPGQISQHSPQASLGLHVTTTKSDKIDENNNPHKHCHCQINVYPKRG